MTWAAVAVAGGAIVGGVVSSYIGSQGQQNAANTQANAAAQAAQAQLQMYYQGRADMAPFRAAGAYGINALTNIIGAGPGGYRGTLPYYDQSKWETPTIGSWPGGPGGGGQQQYFPYGGGNLPYFSQAPPGPYAPPSNLPPAPGLEWNPEANPPGWGSWGGTGEGGQQWQPFVANQNYVWDWSTNQWVPSSQVPAGEGSPAASRAAQRTASAKGMLLSGASGRPPAGAYGTENPMPPSNVNALTPSGLGGPTTIPSTTEPWENRPESVNPPNYAAAQPVPPGGSVIPPQTLPGTPESVWGDWSDRYQASPYFNFLLEEGTKGLERGAAARGRQFSGAEQKALTKYGQDIGGAGYQQWLTNWYNSLTPLQSLAGVGLTGAQQTGNWGMQAGQGMSNAAMAGGAAQAAGQLGQANTWANLVGWGGQQAANLGLYGQSQGWWGNQQPWGAQNYQSPAMNENWYNQNYLAGASL